MRLIKNDYKLYFETINKMPYYLKSVDFENPDSSDITELIKIAKFIINVYNDIEHNKFWYTTNVIDLPKTIPEIIHIVDHIFKTISEPVEQTAVTEGYELSTYDKYKKIFYEKYIYFDTKDRFYFKLMILPIKDDIKYQFLQLYLFSNQYQYHEDSKKEPPFWVNYLPFPYHGGDEETYYLTLGLNADIEVKSSERAYRLKTRNIVLLIDGKGHPITIGRTAHA